MDGAVARARVNGGHLAPMNARRETARMLAAHGIDPTSDAAHEIVTLVNELVTNSVVHAGAGPGDEIEIRVAPADDGGLRVSVDDAGVGFAPDDLDDLGGADPMEGGLGLYLVEQLARQWGVERRDAGTCVWFEVPAQPARAIGE